MVSTMNFDYNIFKDVYIDLDRFENAFWKIHSEKVSGIHYEIDHEAQFKIHHKVISPFDQIRFGVRREMA